jgi:photosystem II stability/assembly factor-like uncharacterized protein
MKHVFYLLFFIGSLFAEQSNWVWKHPYTTGNDLMDICAIDENTAVAVGIFGTIVRTDDGGKTWRQLDAGTGCDFNSVHFVDAQVGWAVGGWPNQTYFHYPENQKEGEIYRTVDGGETWERLLSGDYRESYRDVFFVDRMHGWVLTSRDGILKTNNGGESWEWYPIGNLSRASSFYFLDKNRGWITGGPRIYQTIDGGKTWLVQYYNIDQYFLAIYFVDSRIGWVVGSQRGSKTYNDSSIIMKTTDGGQSWETQSVKDSYGYKSICFVDSLNGWVTGNKMTGYSGYIMHTYDGGVNWEESAIEPGYIDFWANALAFSDRNTGWVIAGLGLVVKTEDGGLNWELSSGFTAEGFYDVCFVDNNTGWLTGPEKVWKTIDGGNHWSVNFDSSNINIYNVCFKNLETGWLACRGGIPEKIFLMKTIDGGQSWKKILLPFNNYRYIADMMFVDTQKGWLIISNNWTNESAIIKTFDGGETWQIKYSTPNEIIEIFALNDSLAYFVKNPWSISSSIFKTSDGGDTWNEFYANAGSRFRSIFFIDPDYDWISGSDSLGGLILRTADGGETWQKIKIEGSELRSIQFLDRNNGFLIGSYSIQGCIWQTEDGGISWQSSFFNNWEEILGIKFSNSTIGWVFGHAGALLKYEGPPVINIINSPSSDLKMEKFSLSQNYPNPFNPVTTITYNLTRNSIVVLSIYNTLGQKIRTLVNTYQPTGDYQVVWDGRDNHGQPVPSGVYIYRLQVENFSDSRKMMLIR